MQPNSGSFLLEKDSLIDINTPLLKKAAELPAAFQRVQYIIGAHKTA
jgi:hypothetical protein